MTAQEESGVVEVFCPSVAELEAEPQVNVPCTVDGCNKTFSTSSARKVHMIQTHRIYKDENERQLFTRSSNKKLLKVTKHFYCPVQLCNRNVETGKPFSRLSLLKQHYHMMHAVKRYHCPKCEKGFSTQGHCASHERYCGREFLCTCGEKHKSVSALYMHAKRKQHELPEEFNSKRRKQEPVKEPGYILVVPVPFSSSQDIEKVMKEPFPLLPHPSICIPTSASTPDGSSSNVNSEGTDPMPVSIAAVEYPGQSDTSFSQAKVGQCLTTTSTQTDESGVGIPQPKQATTTAYAQTAHSCYPSFIPMTSGPRTFKRHKKTSAIQTNMNWPQERLAGQMATSETQTLHGQASTAQTQTVLNLSSVLSRCMAVNETDGSEPFAPLGAADGQFPRQGVLPTGILGDSGSRPSQYSYGVNSACIQRSSNQQISHLEPNSTPTPTHETDVMNTSPATTVATPPVDVRTNMMPPNEVHIQTDLTFDNFLEYSTSETQTFASVSDAMTDTSETPAPSADISVSMGEGEPVGRSNQGSDLVPPDPVPSMEMSGLDLLFLASTEHRTHASLDMPRLDDSFCCQQTQTSLEADTGHQETQTAWDWSLDEFSFLDQYTQTVLSASSSGGATSSVAETDQLCQTGMGLYPQFSFSNTETQTMSMFDLEMFGTSISVQTESGSASGSGLLGGDGLGSVSTQVQASSLPPQQEMVCADVQTEAMDFERLRSRHIGSGQLASSQTQTSFWEDIESLIRSDNFTQTQFP